MIRRFKIITLSCIVAILCNIVVMVTIIEQQEHKVAVLQKVIAAARSGKYEVQEKLELNSYELIEKTEINKILNTIPQEFAFTKYAANIRYLVDKNNLFIDDGLIFKPENNYNEKLMKFNSNLKVAGNYSTLKKLIADIQNLPGIIFINSVSFFRNNEDINMITLNINLSVFFRRETI